MRILLSFFTTFLILYGASEARAGASLHSTRGSRSTGLLALGAKRPTCKAEGVPASRVEFDVEIGSVFTCLLDVPINGKSARLKAVLHGPVPIPHFTPTAEEVTFSEDSQTVTTENEITPYRRATGYWFSVDPGDPVGRYDYSCFVDDVLVGSWVINVWPTGSDAKSCFEPPRYEN
jgi:hypothetical protein